MPERSRRAVLSDLVWPEEAYSRATNIELDSQNPEGVPEYKFTAKSLRLLEEVLSSCRGQRRERAWSVVGPYGSGKSTFGLLVLHLLTGSDSPWLRQCLRQLEVVSPQLGQQIHAEFQTENAKYLPIIITGSKVPLDLALCRALHQAATAEGHDRSWVQEGFLAKLHLALETMDTGISDSRTTLELYQQAAQLARIADYRGLLIIVDEFGKFLERAAWQGELPDLLAAQYLAELASSSPESQVLFFVLLHQGFQHHASSLSRSQWLEWAKIQGRFEQIDFTEDPDNLYDLITISFRQQDWSDGDQAAVNRWAETVWQQVQGLAVFQGRNTRDFWRDLLSRVYPFHPLALYALPRLSTRLGQNERTVFNFLTSDDPLGFRHFLRNTPTGGTRLPSLTLDYLFDYFLSGARFALLPPDVQHRISETDAALDRLGDRHPLEVRLLKTLGALSVLRSEAALPASENVILAALDMDREEDKAAVREVLDQLLERKILVFRKFSGEFRIWQGSDFDFEGALTKTREKIHEEFELSTALNKELLPRPLPVHRHSFETGTPRYFDVSFRSAAAALQTKPQDVTKWVEESQGDGLVAYLIPSNQRELEAVRGWAKEVVEPRLLIVIPHEPLNVATLSQDLVALRRIEQEWPELQDDPVAMKELAGRIEAIEEFLREGIEVVTEPALKRATWYWRGYLQAVVNRRHLNQLLSQVCDKVYSYTPEIRNELINRQSLSSAVVVAVKRIVEKLLEANGKPDLGFTGNGPEVSIFRAVFVEPGLYRETANGNYALHQTPDGANVGLRRAWEEIETYIQASEKSGRSILPLCQRLSGPPYGIRRGLSPLLIWAVLIYHRQSLCIYENGTYLREWSPELFDRFVKVPEGFSVRWLVLSDHSQELLEKLSRAMKYVQGVSDSAESISLSRFLQNLYRWYYQLPEFSKRTLRVSPQSQELRKVLTTAVDPIELVLSRIPQAMGLRPIESIESQSNNATGLRGARHRWNWYSRKLAASLEELSGAYATLCSDMTSALSRAFGLHSVIAELRSFFQRLDAQLLEHIGDGAIRAFLVRARDERASDIQWLESLGAVLTNQAPKFWMDHHFEEFQDKVALAAMSLTDAQRRQFARMHTDQSRAGDIRRVAVEGIDGTIVEQFISDPDIGEETNSMAETLLQHLEIMAPNLPPRYRRLILARALSLTVQESAPGGVSEDD